MKRFITSIILSALILFTAFAQDPDLMKKGFFSNSPKDNWFVSIGGGVQAYYGTEDFTYFSQDNFAPAVDLSFGKWITPSVAFRFQAAGLTGKGWSTTESAYGVTITKGLVQEKFYYTSAHFDLMWSVLDIGDSYRVSRMFKLIPFIGVGAVSTFPKETSTISNASDTSIPSGTGTASESGVTAGSNLEFGVAMAAGFLFNFRFTDSFSINLELRSLFSDGGMDKTYYPGVGPRIEFMNTASLGLQYEIHPAKFVRKYEMDAQYRYDIDQLQRSINSLLKQKALLEDQNKELSRKYYDAIKSK